MFENIIIEAANIPAVIMSVIALCRRQPSRIALYIRNKKLSYGSPSCFEGLSIAFPRTGAAISAANQLSIIDIKTT